MPTRTRRPAKAPGSTRTRTTRALARYNAKRNLESSGEPAGASSAPRTGSVRRFVIQKHDATRLHYDFRLEMEGVLRSWAVPKGLPTKPGDRSLAVEVEDHPLEYGSFEGIIPAGNYGAGTVMLWDRGHYTVSGVEAEVAYREGKMHLALAGEKSVGEWTLVRMPKRHGDAKTNWLLIKNKSPEHRAAVEGEGRDLSVLSGRSLEQIASGEPAAAARRRARTKPPGKANARATPALPGRKAGGPPAVQGRKAGGPPAVQASASSLDRAKFVPVMKALNVEEVPKGDWRLEIKWDGYRALAVLNDGEVELWSRNHKPLGADFPDLVDALRALPCRNAVVDGEIVALDAKGRSRFQLLQNGGKGSAAVVYYAFDLLHHDGRSLLDSPIEERQLTLEILLGKGNGVLRPSPVFDVTPERLLQQARENELEGIIAKRAGSLYEPDRRSGTWLKCKVLGEQEFVIGGFTPPKNSRAYFGALLVGYYDGGVLRYAGKVGTGFNHALLASLHREFMARKTASCPFGDLPTPRRSRFGGGMTAGQMREVTWVKPELVAQIRFTEWTSDGSLRHPVFLGLRKDKRPSEVVREG